MPQQMTSGQVLHEARKRKGYELNTVARRLRIRPDILRAIEAGDFDNMPPKGYARNMVNAYARLLGLNPTEIVNMYLDESYARQVERARGRSRGSGFNIEPESRIRAFRERTARGREEETLGFDDYVAPSRSASSYGTPSAQTRTGDEGSFRRGEFRHLYDDRTQYSRDDYGITRQQVERPGRSDRDFMSHHSGYTSSNYRFLDEGPVRGRSVSGKGRAIHVGQTPMQYTPSRLSAVFQSRGVLIAAIALAVLVVIAIVVFVLGRTSAPPEDDVAQLPVSGITDTTSVEDDDADQTGTVEIAPTSARVVYSVERGDDCYIETYTDGQLSAEMLSGPAENSIEVTGVWTITTYSPGTIKVLVNGSEVTLSPSDEYGGMYAYTVDFPAQLEEWKATHTARSSQRQAAVASAANAASQASSSSSSTSSSSS